MSRGDWLKERFEYLTTTQVKCKTCSAEMDVRAGRAWKHWSQQHDGKNEPVIVSVVPPVADAASPIVSVILDKPPPVPAQNDAGTPSSGGTPAVATKRKPKAKSARGSREWAVERVLEIADAESATHEQKLKALDLLKDYEDYGRERIDDEKEAQESLAQWDRVLEKVDGLQKAEAALLREPAVRVRLAKGLGLDAGA